MAAGRVCMQWTLVIYNTLSVFLGLLGIAAVAYELYRLEDEDSYVRSERIVQLAVAICLVVFSTVGCCAAVNGSIKVLGIFIGLLLCLIVAHTWKLLRYDESRYAGNVDTIVTTAWIQQLVSAGAMNQMQEIYECCGKRSFIDYTSMGLPIPLSCYRQKNAVRATYPYGEGCATAVRSAYMAIYRYEKWANVSLLCFESLGIMLSIVLCCKLMTRTRKYYY